MLKRTVCPAVPALFVALFLLACSQHSLGQSLKYVPESTSLAVQLRAKAAMAEPALMFLPKELIDVFGKKELGLDLMQLDRLLLVVAIAVLLSSLQGYAISLAGERRRVDPHWKRGLSFLQIGRAHV